MRSAFPDIIRHHLGDAEFSLLTTEASEKEDSDISPGLHCHRYYEIHWNTGPRKQLSLPTGDVLLDTGQYVLICPGCMHYSVPHADSTSVLSFELRQITGEAGFYTHFLELLNGLNLKPLPLSRSLRAALTDFSGAVPENTVMGFCRRKLLGLTVLVALLENLGAYARQRDRTYTPEHTGAFDAALDMMLYSELTLSEIARQLGYSTRHTARLIRRRYGDSLGHIRQNAKQKSSSAE